MLEIILIIVYLLGCILVGVAYFIGCLDETNKITLGDLIFGIFIIILSWISIIACLLHALTDFIDRHRDDIIFKR